MSNGPGMVEIPRFDDLSPEEQAAITARCTSAACLAAKAALEQARNDVRRKCEELTQARDDLRDAERAFWVAVATFLALATAAAAAAAIPFVGWIIAGVLLVLAAAALAVVVVLNVLFIMQKHRVDAARERLREARSKFDQAVSDVLAKCSFFCMGDIGQPPC